MLPFRLRSAGQVVKDVQCGVEHLPLSFRAFDMPRAIAILNGKTIASTDTWEMLEGNVYFPPESVEHSFLLKTDTAIHCPQKGDSSYYDVRSDGLEVKDAAWCYSEPEEKAKIIKDHIAFDKDKIDVQLDLRGSRAITMGAGAE